VLVGCRYATNESGHHRLWGDNYPYLNQVNCWTVRRSPITGLNSCFVHVSAPRTEPTILKLGSEARETGVLGKVSRCGEEIFIDLHENQPFRQLSDS
jgi:hypothetical protein